MSETLVSQYPKQTEESVSHWNKAIA